MIQWLTVIVYVFLALIAAYNAYRGLIRRSVNFPLGLILGFLIGLAIDFFMGTFSRGELAHLPGFGAVIGFYFLNREVRGIWAIVIGLCWLVGLFMLIRLWPSM